MCDVVEKALPTHVRANSNLTFVHSWQQILQFVRIWAIELNETVEQIVNILNITRDLYVYSPPSHLPLFNCYYFRLLKNIVDG